MRIGKVHVAALSLFYLSPTSESAASVIRDRLYRFLGNFESSEMITLASVPPFLSEILT